MTRPRYVVPGSTRGALPSGEPLGAVDPDERIEVTVVLRRRGELPGGKLVSAAELADRCGADPRDVELVVSILGLEVVETDAASRRVRLAGTVAQLGDVFGVRLDRVRSAESGGGAVQHRARTGEVSVPGELAGVVVAVLGLDNRPQARTRIRYAATTTTSYTALELATLYRFPADLDGSGQSVAIIELGGGFAQSDLDTYFGGLGLATPAVRAVGVDGAENLPGQDPSGADGEVLLDIEVAGAVVPKAQLLVYFAPNTDAGFLDAISAAAHATPPPAAISISWGQNEDEWTGQARTAMDAALADAAALGITTTVAAGDDGSADRASSGAHADFPASSPHALGCGGTTLHADPRTGAVTSETVWNGGTAGGSTGGGVSDTFPLPDWQAHVGVPIRADSGTGRGVPDVAAVADPATGYQVYVDGRALVIGGTSAVAPLWAGLIARYRQALGRGLGLLQPAIYAGVDAGRPASGFRDITAGSNGAYDAGPGWDPCTGLGVPDGSALLARLRGGSP